MSETDQSQQQPVDTVDAAVVLSENQVESKQASPPPKSGGRYEYDPVADKYTELQG